MKEVTEKEHKSGYGKEYTIETGSFDSVVIDKLFGPTIYCKIKVTALGVDAKWLVEREKTVEDEEGNFIKTEWEKICEIDAQESIFKD